jgi:hypothetical protein
MTRDGLLNMLGDKNSADGIYKDPKDNTIAIKA